MPAFELPRADAVASAATVLPPAKSGTKFAALPSLGPGSARAVTSARSRETMCSTRSRGNPPLGVPGGGPPGEPGASGGLLSMRTVKPRGTHNKRFMQQGQRKGTGGPSR